MNNDSEPIIWHGDLADDCTARWNGLILRAEMDGRPKLVVGCFARQGKAV